MNSLRKKEIISLSNTLVHSSKVVCDEPADYWLRSDWSHWGDDVDMDVVVESSA